MIWPPSNAISIRTRSGSATCNHLRENAVDGIRVDERDLEPEQTGPRALVDQICTRARELRQRRIEIVHLVGNMVHTGPLLGGGSGRPACPPQAARAARRDFAEAHRRRAHALIFDCRAVLDLRTEHRS